MHAPLSQWMPDAPVSLSAPAPRCAEQVAATPRPRSKEGFAHPRFDNSTRNIPYFTLEVRTVAMSKRERMGVLILIALMAILFVLLYFTANEPIGSGQFFSN